MQRSLGGSALTERAPGRPPSPLAIPAVLTALASTVLIPGTSSIAMLIGVGLAFIVLAFTGPAWAVSAILLAEQAIPGYVPGTVISVRLAASLVAVAVAAPVVLRALRVGGAPLLRVLLPALFFLVVVTMVNTFHSDTDYVLKYFRYQITQFLALLLAGTALRRGADLRLVVGVALLVALTSAAGSVWQHFDRDSAFYSIASADDVSGWKGRSIGLSSNPVNLANDMTFVLLPVLGILASGPMRLDRPRLLLAGAALLLFAGCYFSYTRSALIAIGAGVATMGWCLGGQRRTLLTGVVIVTLIAFPLLRNSGLIGARYARDTAEDTSAASHMAVWQVGLSLALANPIVGVGHQSFQSEALDHIDVVDEDPTAAVSGTSSLLSGTAEPHNDFLNVWFSWGIFALLAYLGLFVGAAANCAVALRSANPLIRGLAAGVIGGLVAYAANSALHNYLDSSVYLWVYAGGSASLVALARSEAGTVRQRFTTFLRASIHTARRPRRRVLPAGVIRPSAA